MARVKRADVFSSGEMAVVHVMNRVVRRCFLMGTDQLTGKCYQHHKDWIEDLLRHFAGCFGIDLLTFARIATRANVEDGEVGKFWQSRFKAVRGTLQPFSRRPARDALARSA